MAKHGVRGIASPNRFAEQEDLKERMNSKRLLKIDQLLVGKV